MFLVRVSSLTQPGDINELISYTLDLKKRTNYIWGI